MAPAHGVAKLAGSAKLSAMIRHDAENASVTALLGPTNTGKTHLAVERMLAHRTGMMGFPLRLLAREVYDRVVEEKGAGAVALVTGEERRIPEEPRYFVCTVESMPLDREVEFVGVDEIQLAGDRERGHVFTDRLLRARGAAETMFLGADTMRPLIRTLVPDARFTSRPGSPRSGMRGTASSRGSHPVTRSSPSRPNRFTRWPSASEGSEADARWCWGR